VRELDFRGFQIKMDIYLVINLTHYMFKLDVEQYVSNHGSMNQELHG
jgi:hypothetical protein